MKTIGRLFFLGAGSLCLAFCSLLPSKKPATSPAMIFPLQQEARTGYEGRINGHLQAAGGKIFFSTQKRIVTAVDSGAKKIVWEFAAKTAVTSAPCVGPECIIFFDQENCLYGLDLDGRLRWERKAGAALADGIAENSGRFFLIGDESYLIALDAVDGTEAWRFKAGGAIRTSLVFWNQMIIFGTAEGRLYFLRPQGQPDSILETGSAPAGPLFADGNKLYFALEDGTFHCLDAARKKRLWKVRTGGILVSSPAADDKQIYFVTSNNVLFCLNKKNGHLLWWRIPASRAPFSPTVCGEQVFMASLSPVLIAFKKKTGEQAGTYNAGEGIVSAPIRLGEYLVMPTYNPETSKGALVFLKGQAPKEDKSKEKSG